MDASTKQRLIGAAVLVLLAVIFVPLLVKGPAPESGVSGVSLNIPPEPKEINGVMTQDLPLAVPGAAPAGGAAGMPAAVQTPASEPAEEIPAAEDVPLSAVAAGDFAVSFGSYATSGDAEKVIAALKAVGLPAYQEPVTLGSRQAQRVRIGPFADQAMAESARLRAGRVRSDLNAKVIALNAEDAPAAIPEAKPAAVPAPAPAKPVVVEKTIPAEKPAAVEKPAVAAKPAPVPQAKQAAPVSKPEPAPAKPANPAGTGFVVQIGAFTSSADATAQRDAIRKAGFNAFTDTVSGASGSLTRVRVGPVMTRAEADALKAKLSAQTGKDGQVRPHP